MPDKRQIAASFSRAAPTYDSAAAFQREVGERLLDLLPASLHCSFPASTLSPNPSPTSGRGEAVHCADFSPRPLVGEGPGERVRWLDLGCGSGHFTRRLSARYPKSQGIALDIAQGMLHHAKNQGGAEHWIAADAENLPFADNSFDLLFSNLCLQWCESLAQVLSEARRILRPSGLLAFTSLASGTLAELNAAWQSVDNFTHVNRFRALADYQTVCAASGLKLHHLSGNAELRHYPELRQLTGELKALGAHNLSANRPPGLGGRTRLAAMTRAYQQKQCAKGLPATWQVVYAVLGKEK